MHVRCRLSGLYAQFSLKSVQNPLSAFHVTCGAGADGDYMFAARLKAEGFIESGNPQDVFQGYFLHLRNPHQKVGRQPVEFIGYVLKDWYHGLPAAVISAEDFIQFETLVVFYLDFGRCRRLEIDNVLDQTVFDALTTAGTLVRVHRPRLLPDTDLEVAR